MPLDQKEIGKTIAQLRKQAGFTQKGLADRLFISDKAVSKWERGLSIPDIAFLGKLSVLLDTDIDTLLEGKRMSRGDAWRGFLFLDANSGEISADVTVFDKPLVYYLLSNFLLVGVKEVLIACTESLEATLRTIVGNGCAFGLKIEYAVFEQGKTLGEVIAGNASFFRNSNVMTVFQNSVLYGASLTYLYQRAMLNHNRHTVIGVPVVSTQQGTITFDEQKRAGAEMSVKTKYDYCYFPVLFSPGDLLLREVNEAVTPTNLIDVLKTHDSLFVETANRGMVEIKLKSPEDVLDAANFIRIIQNRTGSYVACLEEIAWRRNMIDGGLLEQAVERCKGTPYGAYLDLLSKE